MCSPIFGLVGGLVSGIGGFMQAQQASASAQYQAKIYDRQADMDAQSTAFTADLKRDEVRSVTGAQIAAYGSDGLMVDNAVVEDSARKGAMDVAAIMYGGQVRQQNLHLQAGMSRFQAAGYKAAAPFAFLSPVLSAAGQFGSSAMSAATLMMA